MVAVDRGFQLCELVQKLKKK